MFIIHARIVLTENLVHVRIHTQFILGAPIVRPLHIHAFHIFLHLREPTKGLM